MIGYNTSAERKFYATWSGMSKSVRESQYIYSKSITLNTSLKKLTKIEVNTLCVAKAVNYCLWYTPR